MDRASTGTGVQGWLAGDHEGGTGIRGRRLLAVLACGLALPWMGFVSVANPANADTSGAGASQPSGDTLDSASLVQCETATSAAERSATFAGEMTMIPGAVKMSMRIELLERAPGETGYHPVLAPGVGVWRAADPGVKAYKHLEQVTNLTAPADYRALITFRWDGPHGRVLRRSEQRSPRCVQSAPAAPAASTPASSAPTTTPLE
jgi:hypothetical protein